MSDVTFQYSPTLTATFVANAELALRLWQERVAPEQVNLDTWGNGASCGTLACFGGWLQTWPEFKSQGVDIKNYGPPRIGSNWDCSGTSVAAALFGYAALFSHAGGCSYDRDFIGWQWPTNHHELVVHRLQEHLRKLRGEA